MLVLSPDEQPPIRRFGRADVTVRVLERRLDGGTPIEAIAEHCRQGAYDVVHTWLPLANMYGSAAARLAGVPRIVTSVRSLNPGRYPQWCQWWYRPADVIAARLADVVTVNARSLARDHGRWAVRSPQRIVVVPNGCELREPDAHAAHWLRHLLGVPADTALLGNVGRLAVEKDHATFLRALAALEGQHRRVHAVLVGDGPSEPALRALADTLGVARHLTFMGARDDARRVIAGLDLLVLTSTIEGFPNVLLEAAMLGVPLVSSNVGGVSDLVNEPAALFPPADPEAAAAAICAALDDRAGTAARTERLRERSHTEFGADRMVQRWLALYRDERPQMAGTDRARGAALAHQRTADV